MSNALPSNYKRAQFHKSPARKKTKKEDEIGRRQRAQHISIVLSSLELLKDGFQNTINKLWNWTSSSDCLYLWQSFSSEHNSTFEEPVSNSKTYVAYVKMPKNAEEHIKKYGTTKSCMSANIITLSYHAERGVHYWDFFHHRHLIFTDCVYLNTFFSWCHTNLQYCGALSKNY